MKLRMNQRELMNMAAGPSGLNRYDVDGSGLRTLRSLVKRELIEPSKMIRGNYDLTDAGHEARKAWSE